MDIDQILCKRQVVLRAIITEDTKLDIALELQRGIEATRQQLAQINAIIKEQKEKNQKIDLKPLEEELKKAAIQEHVLKERLEEVKGLKTGDVYTTGLIDGYSQMKKGDDIREKLGTVEITTKDYRIEEMKVSMPTKTAPKAKPATTLR